VAVKILSDRPGEDQAFARRFRREARAAAALNHPNVVAVYDTGEDHEGHYIVMEHVDGRTLADVLREEGPLPPDRAARIGQEVCRGLAAAHGQGLVHRDVKPANILITTEGIVKVADFGIARATAEDRTTAAGTLLGTASYLAPEQALGEGVDARTDLYALGCVLYELVTGRPPFQGESPMATAAMHVQREPVPPREHRPDVPRALEETILRAMAKDPDDRFQDAEAMAGALAWPMEDRVPDVHHGAATQPIRRRGDTEALPSLPSAPGRRRGRWLIWAGAAAAALIGVVTLVATLDPEPGQRPRAGRTIPPVSSLPGYPPEEAIALVRTRLSEAVAQGALSEDAAGEIGARVDQGLARLAEDAPARAMATLDSARRLVAGLFAEGQIASPEQAARIDQALLTLRTAIEYATQAAGAPG
jgi:serine/threonine-protein kinase